jgi:hypothetical protein
MPIINRRRLAGLTNRLLRHFDMELVRLSELWRITSMLGYQPPPGPTPPGRPGALHVFGPPPGDANFEFSVVIPSILRPTIADTLRSVFAQDFPGPVQTLIGIDQPIGDIGVVEAVCRDRPPHHTVMVLDPGYSTSVRHGGLHPARDGGVLRTVLSYLAASRRVAYLDDDNWWAPNHLSTLAAALEGFDWAWSRRIYVHPETRRVIGEDTWHSVGPYAGTDAADGGWVDPNCLAIDKLRCEAVLRLWGIPQIDSNDGMTGDCRVFRILRREFRGNDTGVASSFYVLNDRTLDEADGRALRDRRAYLQGEIDRIGRAHYDACADCSSGGGVHANSSTI